MSAARHLPRVALVAAFAAGMTLAHPATAGAQRQRDEKAFTFNERVPAGRWVRIKNLNGGIEVSASSSDGVEITATRSWRNSDPESVRFVVDRSGPNDQDVTICALWNDAEHCDERGSERRRTRNNDVAVSFRVALPKGVNIGVSTVNGALEIAGATGQVDATTVNGEIDATSTGGPVNATTVNGSVRARIGAFTGMDDLTFTTVNGSIVAEFTGDLDADVEMNTVNGRFATDYPVTISGRLNPRHLRAKLGKGGRQITLTTVNGNVELRKRGG